MSSINPLAPVIQQANPRSHTYTSHDCAGGAVWQRLVWRQGGREFNGSLLRTYKFPTRSIESILHIL
ncbi:hypothetical protein EYR41_000794 [Orbilia oligospora]|uniref:Uncharacterized protein n=1 Tax=Orbilia oligospora TaxID=2813651 RepID=A0A8H2EDA1_ORBOL|nr:hypothetical protein EYR41_000794 [Orbilia oligospora]